MLGDTFIALCNKYSPNTILRDQLWDDIQAAYSGKHALREGGGKRHYHNLDHLTNMLYHLHACRHLVKNWNSVLFALFFHDLIYDVTSKDNEEKSAVEAGNRLITLNVPTEIISHVVELIIATKSHDVSHDNDVNLFTDADLSILGSPENEYEQYCSNVRKEYSIFPDLLYKPGRRKVLQHFLDMPYIFKTEFFRTKLESISRHNLKNELKKLS